MFQKMMLLNTSAYFGDGDYDGHFNCIERSIIDLKLYESVKFIFSAASIMHLSYSSIETNMLPFLYTVVSFVSLVLV